MNSYYAPFTIRQQDEPRVANHILYMLPFQLALLEVQE